MDRKLEDNLNFEQIKRAYGKSDFYQITESVLGLSLTQVLLRRQEKVPVELVRILEKRLNGEPLQYILGEWEFYGLKFYCDKRALIPREDSEILVSATLEFIKNKKKPRVLDLCAGSGCIGVSVAKNNKNALVTALDISSDALDLCAKNAERHRVSERIKLIKADIFKWTQNKKAPYIDAVVINPPYIPTKELKNLPLLSAEPVIALDGGENGLKFYERVFSKGFLFNLKTSIIIAEIGAGQARAVSALIKKNKSGVVRIIKDISGIERVLIYENRRNVRKFFDRPRIKSTA